MNKKGFTLVEILAVVIILSILVGIAFTSVTKYRVLVREKEAVHLHSEIEATYDNLKLNGTPEFGIIKFCKKDADKKTRIIMNISFDGKRLGCKDDSYAETKISNGSYFTSKNKGELLGNPTYTGSLSGDALENKYIKDGICTVTSQEERDEAADHSTSTSTLVRKCVVNKTTNQFEKATNYVLCIKLVTTDGNIIINDFDRTNNKNKSFCKYFGEAQNEQS